LLILYANILRWLTQLALPLMHFWHNLFREVQQNIKAIHALLPGSEQSGSGSKD